MSDTAVHSKNTVMIVDEYEITNLLSSANQAFDKEYVDTSVFGIGDREGMSGHRGSVLSMEGFRKGKSDRYKQIIDSIISGDGDKKFLYAPEGAAFGKPAWIMDSIEQAAGVSGVNNGAVMISLSAMSTGGARLGKILNTHVGSTPTTRNTIFVLSATNVHGQTANFSFKGTPDGAGGTVSITPGDSTATVKAAIEALAGYGTVNVSGSVPAWAPLANPTLVASATNGTGTYPTGYYQFVYTYTDSVGETLKTSTPFAAQLVAPASFNLTAPALPSGATGTKWYATQHQASSGAAATAPYFLIGTSADNTLTTTSEPAGNEASPPVSNTTGPAVSGSYTVEVADPAAVSLEVPTTASSGWSAVRTDWGVDLGSLNIHSASFNGTAVDNGAATSTGATAHLHAVYGNGSGRSLKVKIQDSADNASWSTIVTFDTLTNIGKSRKTLAAGATVRRYVRAIVDTGDITGDWAFTVALSRHT